MRFGAGCNGLKKCVTVQILLPLPADVVALLGWGRMGLNWTVADLSATGDRDWMEETGLGIRNGCGWHAAIGPTVIEMLQMKMPKSDADLGFLTVDFSITLLAIGEDDEGGQPAAMAASLEEDGAPYYGAPTVY
ncbi:hypothetical protein ACLOJK_027201 [Asimina triloba]